MVTTWCQKGSQNGAKIDANIDLEGEMASQEVSGGPREATIPLLEAIVVPFRCQIGCRQLCGADLAPI